MVGQHGQESILYAYASRFDEIKEKTDPLICLLLKDVDFKKIDNYRYVEYIKYIMVTRIEDGEVENFIISNWESIINALFNCVSDLDDCESILEIFDSYDIDFSSYSRKRANSIIIRSNIERIAEQKTEDAISSEKNHLRSEYDFEGLKDRICVYRSVIFTKFGLEDYGFDEDYYFDGIDEKFFKCNVKNEMKKKESILKLKIDDDKNFTEKDIDDLFYTESKIR